jgi:serine/threonine-protein kinase
MAPEQAFGEKDIDHRVDVWAVGVMLYEALSGGRPVEGDNAGQILKRLLSDGIVPLRVAAPDVPEGLAALVDQMLARAREDRPCDLRVVARELSKHTTLEATAFGAPDSCAQPEFDPKRQVVRSGNADPDAATERMSSDEARAAVVRSQAVARSGKKTSSRSAVMLPILAAIGAALAFGRLSSSQPPGARPLETNAPRSVDAPASFGAPLDPIARTLPSGSSFGASAADSPAPLVTAPARVPSSTPAAAASAPRLAAAASSISRVVASPPGSAQSLPLPGPATETSAAGSSASPRSRGLVTDAPF